ncbi:MAG: AAA family ATPase, partial [Candidatus Adiutrix sp.]|nr:AAA family ATPase [Candidatus Adiutrix sp.]
MSAPPEETLSGRIERVTFANPDNGWTVLAVRTAKPSRAITAVGHLPSPAAGEFIEMIGRFVEHAQFGRQFQISRARLLPPKTEAGLKKYLGSGLIKGVGPVLAGRLVDYFGPTVLEILDQAPERLIEVPGLGASRRETIIEGWRRNQGLKRLLGFLAEFGLGPTVGLRVMRRLGGEAESLIREDPYRLAYDIEGVGFATADKVALRLGLGPADPRRLAAGLLFALNQFADEGHVYTPERELLAAGAKLLPEAEPAALKEALARLFLSGQIKSGPPDEPGWDMDIYPPRLHRAEDWVARDLLAILRTPASIEVPRQPQALAWAEKALGLNLSESQRQAVALALSQKVLVITGGPGTGKTTLTRAITAIFGALRARLGLVAPTGRAARRLAEATGLAAKTVHRLLEYAPQVGFQRHPERKLELDLLLVDEASMVDLPLMNQLTGALPHAARLILVGDRDQLPSVGPGRVLADLIDSQAVAVARLTEVHRQAEGSQIVRAA